MAPLRWVDNKHFRAILFRRTFPDLEKSLIDRSRTLYRSAYPGARYSGQTKSWTFPSGAIIYFGYCEHDDDVFQYQSAEFSFLGFDELTHFTEKQYTYLLSRARSSKGLPIRVRAATNPGGPGHDWVMQRWAPWLDTREEYDGKRAALGQTLWYVTDDDVGASERYCEPGTPDALSRVFIPSKVTDNPHLMLNDPQYVARLKALDPVTRAQLLHGDWLTKPARGLLFKRHWFEIVDEGPEKAQRCRYWDLAATEDGGAFTAGVLMALADDGIYIEDVVRGQWSPGQVETVVQQTAEIDGHDVMVALPQDPGQAGVAQVATYQQLLQGYNVQFLREVGDKVDRAKLISAQAEPRGGNKFGRVKLVRGPWNLAYLKELEAFPDEKIKDQVDATSGAFNKLTGKPHAPYTGMKRIRSPRADTGLYGNR